MAAALALLASVLWGTADFLGGVLARRVRTGTVVAVSQVAGLVVLLVAAPFLGVEWGAIGWGAAAGVVGGTALLAFYRALADGRMSVVAPIAATGISVPVVGGLFAGERPSALALAGIAVTAFGIVLASGPELRGGYGSRRSVWLACVAACGFGTVLVLVNRGSDVDVFTTLLGARCCASLLAAVATRPEPPRRADLLPIAAVGLLDLGAVGMYALASRGALVAVAAVLASLYPVVTAVLARYVFDERLRPVQLAGVAAALAGVVAIAAG